MTYCIIGKPLDYELQTLAILDPEGRVEDVMASYRPPRISTKNTGIVERVRGVSSVVQRCSGPPEPRQGLMSENH